MMAITEAMIRQYQHPRIKIVIGALTLYEDDMVSGSFAYKAGVSAGGAFAPGGCVISSCSFSVYNKDGSLSNTFTENAQVTVYIGYGATNASATYDKLCTMFVANVKKRNYRLTIQCFDKLRAADKHKWTAVTFPSTVNTIIQSAATQAGIQVNQYPTAGGGIQVDLRDSDGNQPTLDITCRQALSEALLISGNYGYLNADGQLVCGWYSNSADEVLDADFLFDFSYENEQTYTGVQVYGQTPTGSTTRLYVLSSATFLNDVNKVDVQSRLAAALMNKPIMTADVTAVCNPNIKQGMILQVPHPEAGVWQNDNVYIMDLSIAGGFLAKYSSETISADEADDLRKSEKKTTEDVAKGDYPTKEEMEEAIDEAIAGGGGGVLVHFPEVEMQCSDPTHWFAQEAPCSPTGGCATVSHISIGYNQYTQKTVVYPQFSNGGYDFDRIIWYSGDAMIPAYNDPNVPIEFDITLYLYMFDVSVGAVPSFLAEDTVNNQLYLLPVHARAKYYGSDIIYFSQQWVRLPANYANNIINSEIMIPLPSRRFNIATSQWILNSTGINGETYYAPVRYL